MRRFLDTRLTRVARSEGATQFDRGPPTLAAEGACRGVHPVAPAIGPAGCRPGIGRGVAARRRGRAELAGIPDTPNLRETDGALLARDHPGTEGTFETRLWHLVRHYRDGRELDTASASLAELLAAYVARPPPLSAQAGEEGAGGALG